MLSSRSTADKAAERWLSNYLVGDQNGGLVGKAVLHAVLEDVLGGVVVHGRESVVQEHHIATIVGAAGKVETLALAARQVDATQAGLHMSAGW